ncbi:MAG: hypothetical protein CM15mV51_0790 [uncultured marine virus]|nr:MAG: hypothetical protein CM15mV51_0790 [uncultured marine virus]
MSVKPKDTPKFDFQGGDVYTNPAVSSAQRANLNNALNLTDFNEVQKY